MTLTRQVQRVSACGLARDGDALLLVHIGRSAYGDAGKWTVPGGGIEHGEDPREAVTRAFSEQTGLTVETGQLLHVGSDYRHLPGGIDFHGIFIVYAVSVTSGELRPEPDGAVLSPTWVKPSELDSLPVLDAIKPVLQI
ncbi:NUDIX hydrolase [Catelliglobosispora koreensis]|uniref:NUDIX hydrolase n=1 Tax=Catelliglobosispora koreensis TaxID=129052 RepID=UPI000360141F|nr:NUDIX domain-containing protein [Catelliglobosispora koreensis]